ncbi:hypothetical protein ACFO3J_34625 [Streptomyces polygonati]|uniref:Uncharacterized protein n=1 Tax=Streptomyces polygonati TaxID=1617087 RepID=A0ABV8HZK6_9ACTN
MTTHAIVEADSHARHPHSAPGTEHVRDADRDAVAECVTGADEHPRARVHTPTQPAFTHCGRLLLARLATAYESTRTLTEPADRAPDCAREQSRADQPQHRLVRADSAAPTGAVNTRERDAADMFTHPNRSTPTAFTNAVDRTAHTHPTARTDVTGEAA